MRDTPTLRRKPMLNALRGETQTRPPIWLMRQAGRYLPEYRAVRAEAGGFLELCYRPDLAAEVTLQPIRRFGFDAAILFADILLVPEALGQNLWFETGEGPRLDAITDIDSLKSPEQIHEKLEPVYETVSRVCAMLPDDVTMIGFAGAPWTVMTYMIAGQGTKDQAPAHNLLKNRPDAFFRILDRVTDATILYLDRQIRAGAEVVKLFDSWAGSLPDPDFDTVSIKPCRRIVTALKAMHPEVLIIGFPRGVGERAARFAIETGVDCVAIGQDADIVWARDHLQPHVAVQGNLDPALMVSGGEALDEGAEAILDILGKGPFIFNLGHGITPDADPANVERLVRLVKG